MAGFIRKKVRKHRKDDAQIFWMLLGHSILLVITLTFLISENLLAGEVSRHSTEIQQRELRLNASLD